MSQSLEQLLHLAKQFSQQGDRLNVEKICQLILQNFPENLQALELLSVNNLHQGNYEIAISQLVQLAQKKQTDVRAYLQLGEAYNALYEKETAAHKLSTNLSNVIAAYRCALAIEPDHIVARYNLGTALYEQGQTAAAIKQFETILLSQPHFRKAIYGLAFCQLALGNYQQGFRAYLARDPSPQLTTYRAIKDQLYPQTKPWQGEDLLGHKILLISEQGFGDSIQFIRYAKLVAESADKVFLVCPPELQRLATSVVGLDAVFSHYDELPQHDFFCSLMDLPAFLKTDNNSIPQCIPYLAADSTALNKWQARFQNVSALKVGISWAGNKANSCDYKRSLALPQLKPLLEIEGVNFYSLQKDSLTEELDQYGITDLIAECHDFNETAAALSQMDLIISVCTATAHLAGALGKPVWIMLAATADWRWLENREDSPWYPTAKLFRQPVSGDWDSVIKFVVEMLRHKVATP